MGWETILSVWEGPIFRGRDVSFGEGMTSYQPKRLPNKLMVSKMKTFSKTLLENGWYFILK